MYREEERKNRQRKGKKRPRKEKKGNRVRRRIVKMDDGNDKVKTCVYGPLLFKDVK
jgi:hypothetical protein